MKVFRGHERGIVNALFQPKHESIISIDTGGHANLWDFDDGKIIRSFTVDPPVYTFDVSPDGNTFAVSNYANIIIYNYNGNKIKSFEARNCSSLSYDSSGTLLAFESANTVQVYNLKNDKKIGVFYGKERPGVIKFTNNDKYIVSADNGIIIITKWNESKNRCLHSSATFFDVSNDNKIIATSSYEEVNILDIESKQKLSNYSFNGNVITDIKFTPDNKHILTSNRRGELFACPINSTVISHKLQFDDWITKFHVRDNKLLTIVWKQLHLQDLSELFENQISAEDLSESTITTATFPDLIA